jgi:copper resistance protein D
MTILTMGIRVVQLMASVCLVGVLAFLLAVARPAFTMGGSATWAVWRRIDRLLLRLGRWSLLGLCGFGLLGLWVQLTLITGRSWVQALTVDILSGFLTGTHYGQMWLMRLVLMGFLGWLLWGREPERDGRAWGTQRLACAGLAAGLLMAQAWSGHAAAAEGLTLALRLVVDAFHLLAAGIWLGGLPLLAVLLTWAGHTEDPGTTMIAAQATRRFSALGLASVGLLVLTGLANAWALVGTFPALVGTPYGRLLLLKVSVLLPVLVLAALNRLRDMPQLLGVAQNQTPANGQEILWRLRRHVLGEAALGGCILLLVGGLAVMPPAAHGQPVWPFAFRLSWVATRNLPGVQGQFLIGMLLALGGGITASLAIIKRMPRWPWIATAGVVTMAV